MTGNSPALPWIPRARGRRRARRLYFLLHAGRHHQLLRRLKFLDSPCANCRTEPQHLVRLAFHPRSAEAPEASGLQGGCSLISGGGAGLGGCPASRWLLPDQGQRTGSQRTRTAAWGLWGCTGRDGLSHSEGPDTPRSFAPPSPRTDSSTISKPVTLKAPLPPVPPALPHDAPGPGCWCLLLAGASPGALRNVPAVCSQGASSGSELLSCLYLLC